jgi:hypothetical protein
MESTREAASDVGFRGHKYLHRNLGDHTAAHCFGTLEYCTPYEFIKVLSRTPSSGFH